MSDSWGIDENFVLEGCQSVTYVSELNYLEAHRKYREGFIEKRRDRKESLRHREKRLFCNAKF